MRQDEPPADSMPVLVWINVGSSQEAYAIAERCVSLGLAAAVNIDPVDSFYRWEGAVCRAAEHRLCIKTMSDAVEQVQRLCRDAYSYAEPAILVSPVLGGSPSYLSWIRGNVVVSGS